MHHVESENETSHITLRSTDFGPVSTDEEPQ